MNLSSARCIGRDSPGRENIILHIFQPCWPWSGVFGASFLAGRNGGAGAKKGGILGRDRMEGFAL